MRYSDWEQRQMDIKSGEELDRHARKLRRNALKVCGISRVSDNPQVLLVGLSRRPTDDEMRAVHDLLKSRVLATCPFCAKSTYVLPCSHCGEPDIPEGF